MLSTISLFLPWANYILLEIQYVFTADNRVTFQPKEESPFAMILRNILNPIKCFFNAQCFCTLHLAQYYTRGYSSITLKVLTNEKRGDLKVVSFDCLPLSYSR
jgi:hypothetical protein